MTSGVKKYTWVVLSLAFLGFLDASYLAIEKFLGTVPPCGLAAGCEVVTLSSYSTIFGIPVALLGSLYYLAVFCALVWLIQTHKQSIVRFLKKFTVIGLLASIYFVYLQLFVLHAICTYCMASAATSTALFVLMLLFPKPGEPATV